MHSEFYGPDIAAASDDGLLAAAYFQGHSVIPYSVWDGTRWKAGTIGVLHANTDAVKPSLAAATDGSYLAAWTRHTWTPAVSEDSQVAAARWNGATWVPAGTEGRFEVTDDRGFLCCPSLATGPDGTGYLAWRSSGAGGGPGWIYVRKSVGTAWQEMDNSASGYGISGIEGLAGSPSVAISDDGTVYVAWEFYHFGGTVSREIHVRRWSGNTWGEVGEGSASGGGINEDDGFSVDPSIDVAPDGTVYVAWCNRSPDYERAAIYVLRWSGGAWGEVGQGSATGDGIGPSGLWSKPSLVVANDGTPYVAWMEWVEGVNRLHVKRWTGAVWEETTPGSGIGIGGRAWSDRINNPDIAASPSGTVFLAYNELGGSAVYVRKSVAETTWIEPGVYRWVTAEYRDPDGWQDLRFVDLLLNSQEGPYGGLAVRYDVQADLMYLHHPRMERWMPLSGRKPGTLGTLGHIYGRLGVGHSKVATDTNSVSVAWLLRPTRRMSGRVHNVYTRVEDVSGNSTGWVDAADLAVNRTPNWLIPPDLRNQTISVQDKHWFYPKYRDLDKRDNLDELHFFIGDELPVVGRPMPEGVWLKYDRTSDQMWLWDPRWDFWVGPQTPRTAFRMTNEYVTVRGPGSRVINCDWRTLGVKWYLQFKPAFVGRHRLYMRAVDVLTAEYGGDTGWKWKGWIEVAP